MSAGQDIERKATAERRRRRRPAARPRGAARARRSCTSSRSTACSSSASCWSIVFSILLPQTFTGIQTFRAILGNNTTVALLAMAEMIVIATGNYDLSIAYNVGLMHIMAMGLLDRPRPALAAGRRHHHRRRRRWSAGSTACSSNTPRSTPSSPRSASARSSTASARWYTNGTQLVGNVPHGLRQPQRRQAPRHPAPDLHGRGGRDPRLGLRSSTCRSAAGSTPSARTAAPPS